MASDLSARLRELAGSLEEAELPANGLRAAADLIDQQAKLIAAFAEGAFLIGQRVRKRSGSSWQGHVVGYYVTSLTPVGYCVESEREPGSVQIYPEAALETAPEDAP